MAKQDMRFEHHYEVEIDSSPEFPGSGSELSAYYFPRDPNRPFCDGLWVTVQPASSRAWRGVFAHGFWSSDAYHGVLSTPDPLRACFVSKGRAYLVNTQNPDDWEEIPMLPVTDVRLLLQNQLLLFANRTELIAYGRRGIVWRSSDLCWDELRIVEINGDQITCAGAPEFLPFSVNLKTGIPGHP